MKPFQRILPLDLLQQLLQMASCVCGLSNKLKIFFLTEKTLGMSTCKKG